MKIFLIAINFSLAIPIGVFAFQHLLRAGFEEQYQEPEEQLKTIKARRFSFLIFATLTAVLLMNAFYLYSN
ncbi:MAG: hypothetical protein HYY98_00890 [Burkholderiales bacterium]|nr:hypothetical protein [Burkholderiales bacterium]